MATNLKTDYKDYIPPESGKRYIITTDSQGYSTIQDATEYTQEGDTFGANDINTTNNTINNLTAADVGAVPLADAGIKVTPLWKGKLTTNNTTVQLSQSILNFTMLLVTGTTNSTGLHWGIGNLLPVAKDSHADFGGDSYVSGGSDGSGLARIITVSYTHLDVYKRQRVQPVKENGLFLRSPKRAAQLSQLIG